MISFTDLYSNVPERPDQPMDTPSTALDRLPRLYNAFWGMATRTNMHKDTCCDGQYIITGDVWKDKAQAEHILYDRYIQCAGAGFDAKQSGYCCLSALLAGYGLQGEIGCHCGEPALLLKVLEPNREVVSCDPAMTTTESKMPVPVPRAWRALCESGKSIKGVQEALGCQIYEQDGAPMIIKENAGKVYILPIHLNESEKVDAPDIYHLLKDKGLGDLYLVKVHKGFRVDSDDMLWKNVLRKNKFNLIYKQHMNDLEPEQWAQAVLDIVNTIA